MVSGDLDANAGVYDIYDSYVEEAVRRVPGAAWADRRRHPARTDARGDERAGGDAARPARANSCGSDADHQSRHPLCVCNIPAARIEAIEGGVAVSRHTAVVGKPDRPSPDINSKIVEINFNPYWTVPVSIVRQRPHPADAGGAGLSHSNHIRIFDRTAKELHAVADQLVFRRGGELPFKQDPGDFNSLGSIRINFPSKDGVYMHDTPPKNCSARTCASIRRAACGCKTCANWSNWLLDRSRCAPGIDASDQERRAGNATLVKPVPLYWVYVTAWSASDGIVQFREDIYGRDGLGGPPSRRR